MPVEAARILSEAYRTLTRSSSWRLIPMSQSSCFEAAARPGLQWHRSIRNGETAGWEVLISGEDAYLKGVFQYAVLGWTRGRDHVAAVVGDRWLRCDAAAFLRAGDDHSALGQLAKFVAPDRGRAAAVAATVTTDEGTVYRLARRDPTDVISVLVPADGHPPTIVALGSAAEPDLHELAYDDAPLSLPEPRQADTVDLRDAVSALASLSGRKRPRRRRADGPQLRVHVFRETEDATWTVSSTDVVDRLAPGEGGHVAEARVVELLAARAPHLLDSVTFDSSGDEVIAVAPSEQAARELAALIESAGGR